MDVIPSKIPKWILWILVIWFGRICLLQLTGFISYWMNTEGDVAENMGLQGGIVGVVTSTICFAISLYFLIHKPKKK